MFIILENCGLSQSFATPLETLFAVCYGPSQIPRQSAMSVQVHWLQLQILATLFSAALVFPCCAEEQIPKLNYEPVPDFFQLPAGEHFVEVAGVAVNSKGHIFVFHRGKHPLMEFDANGKYLRSIADDLFVTAHTVRVDAEDNIWTTDVGSHVVLKLSPEGRGLLSLGRMRTPGDDVLHFNQPTDVAFDREGNIYVADGEGNSRVLKCNKYGNVLLGWARIIPSSRRKCCRGARRNSVPSKVVARWKTKWETESKVLVHLNRSAHFHTQSASRTYCFSPALGRAYVAAKKYLGSISTQLA